MSSSISYLTVYNAHNGVAAKIPKPVRFSSLQKLKDYLRESFTDDIIGSTDNVFLLTPFGIKLDFAMINEMPELYLYDRRLFQKVAERALLVRYLDQGNNPPIASLKPEPLSLFGAPSGPASPQNIKELSTSLKTYEKWTDHVALNLRHISDRIDVIIRQINVVFKALNVILSFASNFVGSAEKSFKSQFNHVKMLAMKSLNKSWKSYAASLEEFPPFRLKDGSVFRLADYVDHNSFSEAARYVSEHLPGVVSQFNDLSSTVNKMNEEKLRVDKFIETHRRESMTTFENFDAERQSLNSQVESLVAEIAADMRTLDTAPSDELQKHHTKHTAITQQLYEKAVSSYKFLQSFDGFLARLVLACPEVFENVATQQMKCVEVKLAVKSMLSSTAQTKIQPGARNVFAKIREHESLLSTCVDLPLLFGVVLIEKRRQFEWHDFYSKGIIANVSEQLAVIIEDEKIYQKLWIKEFGSLIKLFNSNTDMHVRVPAIDVTLVNSGLSSSENSVLHWLGDSRVERADVLNYIESVRHHRFVNNDRFAALLEKNFRGLVMCTEKLKAVTKAVVSLRSHAMSRSDVSSQSQSRVQENGLGVEEDVDLKLIKGLKSRVKKLEDLLHQQQFKNLTGWPVVKSNDGQPSETKASLLLSKPRTDSAVHNPINLLPKAVPSRKPSQESVSELSNRKYMDASTTIDKHLDNIRLRRENSELRAAASELASQNGSLKSDLEACRQTCEDLKSEHEEVRSGLEEQVASTRAAADEEKSRHKEETASLQKAHDTAVEELKTRLASLEKTLELKHSQNSRLESEIAVLRERLQQESSATSKDNEALRDEISTLTAKLSDLSVMNAELLSNMQAKESEVSTERSETEKRTKDLEYKLEEKTEDFEHLMEMTQGKSRSMEELLTATNRCIRSLLGGVGGLLTSHVKYFHDLCVILESMGLLLVREVNGETKLPEFRIRRVKGLRSKKDTDGSRPHLERTQSTAVQEITKGFEWITEFAEQQRQTIEPGAGAQDASASAEEITHDPDALEAETQQLLQLCETYVMSKGGAASKVSEFLGTVAFEENVQLQAHEDGREFSTDRFFPNGIIKRFNDVEGFAKRLTKETKAKSSELAKATKQANGKVSVKNFQAGDLVLFLPTRIEHAHDNREAEPAVTPWAAFNIDAPHYFLELGDRADSISSEEWIVSRIASITDHVVTEANAQDAAANPFALSVGITWHMIQTE